MTVDGAVDAPATYTLAELEALPQTSLPIAHHRAHGATATGVLLEDLVQLSSPTLPDAKNALLRVTLTVDGRGHGAVTLALGELDPSFGNHPALITVEPRRGHRAVADLVVPGDRDGSRTVRDVHRVQVAVVDATPTAPFEPGDVTVSSGHRVVTLSAHDLASLPARTLTVTFQAGTGPQTHVETGPSLRAVLHLAGIRAGPTTAVAAVGSDGYIATVTPAEATAGGRPLLISTNEDGTALTQPRLVAVGDVKGGRDVFDVVDLIVTDAHS